MKLKEVAYGWGLAVLTAEMYLLMFLGLSRYNGLILCSALISAVVAGALISRAELANEESKEGD